jgi:N6-adenosine-specific RNA methylase IME4
MQAPPVNIPVRLDEIDVPNARRPVDAAMVKAIAASIKVIDLQNPISLRRGDGDRYVLVAGRHRMEAFRELERDSIPAMISSFSDLEAELVEIDENLCRANLSPAQEALALVRRKEIYESLYPTTKAGVAGGKARQGSANDKLAFAESVGSATGKSRRTVERMTSCGRALSGLADVVGTSLDEKGELEALATLAPASRAALAARAAAGERVSAKAQVKKDRRAVRERELGQRQHDLPDGKFGVVVADPEWNDEVWSEESGMDRHAANHYPTSAADIIKSRPVADIAADDSVLFLWATNHHLRVALDVMEAWGFAYKSNYCWGKDRISLGRWQRGKHELLLIGTRGNPPCPAPGTQFESLIAAPKGEHSAKPAIFLEMIERYFPTMPKIELNCRGEGRPGWSVWGNEAREVAAA